MSFAESITKNAAGNITIQFKDGSSALLALSSSGSVAGVIPVGAVTPVLSNLAGAYNCTATTAADSLGFVQCNGQTLVDPTSPMNGAVIPNINNGTFLAGHTTSGSTSVLGAAAGASVTLASANLPTHTHGVAITTGNSNTSLNHSHGAGSYQTSIGFTPATLTGTQTFASSAHTHTHDHFHKWATLSQVGNFLFLASASVASGVFNTQIEWSQNSPAGSNSYNVTSFFPGDKWVGNPDTITTSSPSGAASVGISGGSLTGSNAVTGSSGAVDLSAHAHNVNGNTDNGGFANSSFSILPTYLTAKYVIRVK